MAARSDDVANRKTPARGTMAERADKHELYEAAVQNVTEEVRFVSATFKELRNRQALSFREDFCGTASLSCAWVRQGEAHTAVGVDIDPEVLDWGRRNRLAKLKSEQQARVQLIEADVLAARTPQVDLVGAFNFSYWIFKTRPQMRAYFSRVRAALKPDGLFFLDAFGGSEAFEEMTEKTKLDGFSYIWDQHSYHPVSGDIECHIHFKFPDKSKMKRAFSYYWRLWTLPEIKELLVEAGFRNPVVYWEGTDEEGEGNGEFKPETQGEADAGWIAYIVAER